MPGHTAARRLGLAAATCVLLALLGLAVWHDAHPSLTAATATAKETATATTRPTPPPYTLYTYFAQQLPPDPWHAGDSVTLLWQPQPSQGPALGWPPMVVCTVALYGPYTSREAARSVNIPPDAGLTSATASPVPMPAFAGPPLKLDALKAAPQPYVLALPATLPPGYYMLVTRSSTSTGEVTASPTVVELSAATS